MITNRHLVLCVPNTPRRPENTSRLFTLGTLHLRAAAQRAGWRCSIIDAYFDNLSFEETCCRIRAAGPTRAIGFTINSLTMQREAERLAEAFGEIEIVLAGGFLRPEAVMAHPRFAAVVRGEGEETLRELLAWADDGKPDRAVAGAHLRARDGSVVVGPRRAPLVDLDVEASTEALPESLQPDEHSIVTSRGCSARCNYCVIGPHWSRYGEWRGASAKWIADELSARIRLGATHVNIVDDQFVGPPESIERAKELARLLRDRRFLVPFVIMARADTVCAHPSVFRELREVGLGNVFLGLESGNASVLRTLRKDATVRDAVEAVSILDQLGVGIAAGTIVFHPWATARTLRRDRAFFGQLLDRYDRFHFYGLNELDVLHGTPLATRFGDREGEDWRMHWQFEDPLAERVYRAWLRACVSAIYPLMEAVGVRRQLPTRRAVNRCQLDTLEDIVEACVRGDSLEEMIHRAHVRAYRVILAEKGPSALARFLCATRNEEEQVDERCFD